jgi:hypothetical protein
MGICRIQALDGGYTCAAKLADSDHAGAHRLAIDVHRAGAACADAATVFCAYQPQVLADDP